MTEKSNSSGLPATRKKYTPAFKAECVRQVAAGVRQSDVAHALLRVAHYLDTYFNLDRRHSAPSFRSPQQFEQ